MLGNRNSLTRVNLSKFLNLGKFHVLRSTLIIVLRFIDAYAVVHGGATRTSCISTFI